MKGILKTVTVIILMAAMLISLLSCSDSADTEDVPTGMQIAEKAERYTFYVPENWIVQEKIDGVSLAYAPNSDRSSISLYSTAVPEGIGVEEYWQSYAADYAQYKDFNLISAGKKIAFGTPDARIYEMTFTVGEVGYQSFQCFCIKDGYVYIMTYLARSAQKTDEETYYSDNFSEADYSRQCFKLTDNGAAEGTARTPFADEGTPEGMKLISDISIVDYKLFVPNEWTIDMQGGYTSAYESESRASVGVSYTIPSARDLGEYITSLEGKYGIIYSEFSGMKEGDGVMLGDVQGYVYTYTATYAGKSIKCKQVFAIVSSYVYTITYTAEADDFDTHLAEADKIISEFRFV